MNCTKCGKEIPEGEKKICDDCQKKLLEDLENENKEEIVDKDSSTTKENSYEEKKVENTKSKENKKKNKLIPFIIAIFFIILIAVLLLSYINKDNNVGISLFKNNVGNSIANIRNYGYTAEQGGWIYFVAPSEDGTSISIYKSKKDGTDKKELVKDNWDVLGLNVVGDHIYFIGISDEEIEKSSTLSLDEESLDTLNNKIYRMKLDGTELEVINSNEFHNNCYEIYVIEDKIYYIGVDTNIYYMNLDGSNKTRLNDDGTGFLGVTKDYIILNIEKKKDETKENSDEKQSTSYETYIMNRDGSNKKSLTGERLYSVNIVGDYIYYVDDTKAIYKVKVDGTENALVSDEVIAYNMNINNNKIYYMSYTSDSKDKIAIYTMNLDGSDNKMIYELDNYSSFLNTMDDKVIFMDSNENSASINMINSEGADKIILYELKYEEKTENVEGNSAVEDKENVQNVTVENTTTTEEKQ